MKTVISSILAVALVVALMAAAPILFPSATYAASGEVSYATWTATGSAQNFYLGYQPNQVIITQVSGSYNRAFWHKNMASGGCFKTLAAGTASYATVSCVTMYSGTTTSAQGFTLGADTDLNINGMVLNIRASRY